MVLKKQNTVLNMCHIVTYICCQLITCASDLVIGTRRIVSDKLVQMVFSSKLEDIAIHMEQKQVVLYIYVCGPE